MPVTAARASGIAWNVRDTFGVNPDPSPHALWDDRLVQPAVLIVDDHAGFRAAARALLEAAGYTVAGEADGAAEALAAARLLRPGVVLLDVELPDGDGFQVADALTALPDPPAVLLVSVRDRPAYRARVARSPALGFIVKDRLSTATLAEALAQ
jgi:DNA-binding NarL/FixJ family response regulator